MKIFAMDLQKRKRTMAFRVIPLVLGAFAIGFLFQLSTFSSRVYEEPQPQLSSRSLITNQSTNILVKKRAYDDENELQVKHRIDKEDLWLKPKLFNLNFTWIQNNETICARREHDQGDLRIVPVLVHTARSHFAERLAIRKTWGSMPIYKKWDLRFIFLLGEPTPPKAFAKDGAKKKKELVIEKKKLAEEQAKFGDVVIGSFQDSYHNLTYKHMMGYKWVLNFCRNATVVLKIDDDVFIDIRTWLDWLTEDMDVLSSDSTAVESVPDIYCKIWAKSAPFRKRSSKWYVSYKDWPKKYYPPFCSGWAYTIPVDIIEKIYSVSEDIKFNWIDDVFVTGQLLQIVKDRYDYTLRIGDLTPEVTKNPKDYHRLCNGREKLKEDRQFKVVAKVDRGKRFERDMWCMWNITLANNT